MGKVITGMRMSLDEFINDPNGSVDPLYPDMNTLSTTDPIRESIQNTGAVVMGRNSFDMAGDDPNAWINYEFQVPIFVLTHHPPTNKPKSGAGQSFTFVTDGIESAVAQAKKAAGGKDVAVIPGASTTNQCLQSGMADELQVDVMPVLLGGGLRPFEAPGLDRIKLERIKVIELDNGGVHVRYRVVNRNARRRGCFVGSYGSSSQYGSGKA